MIFLAETIQIFLQINLDIFSNYFKHLNQYFSAFNRNSGWKSSVLFGFRAELRLQHGVEQHAVLGFRRESC